TAAQRSGLNFHDYGIADRPAAVAGHAGHPHCRLAGGLAPPRQPLCRLPVLHSEQCTLGHLGLAQSGLGTDSAAAEAVRDESARHPEERPPSRKRAMNLKKAAYQTVLKHTDRPWSKRPDLFGAFVFVLKKALQPISCIIFLVPSTLIARLRLYAVTARAISALVPSSCRSKNRP